MTQVNYTSGSTGAIAPSIFVVTDTTNWKAVNPAANATTFIVGISQEGAQGAPIPGASTNAALATGDPIMVYQIGDVCLLQATTAGWTAGDRLTANSLGQGITASGTNYYGAIALETMSSPAAGALGQVQVVLGKNP